MIIQYFVDWSFGSSVRNSGCTKCTTSKFLTQVLFGDNVSKSTEFSGKNHSKT